MDPNFDEMLQKLRSIRMNANSEMDLMRRSLALIGATREKSESRVQERADRIRVGTPTMLQKLVDDLIREDQHLNKESSWPTTFGYWPVVSLVQYTSNMLRVGSVGNWLQSFWLEHNYNESLLVLKRNGVDITNITGVCKFEAGVTDASPATDEYYYGEHSVETAYFVNPESFVSYVLFFCLEKMIGTDHIATTYKFSRNKIHALVREAMRPLKSLEMIADIMAQKRNSSNFGNGKGEAFPCPESSVMHKRCVQTVAVAIENLIRSSRWWPVASPGYPNLSCVKGGGSVEIIKNWEDRFLEENQAHSLAQNGQGKGPGGGDVLDDGVFINETIHLNLFEIFFEYLKRRLQQEQVTSQTYNKKRRIGGGKSGGGKGSMAALAAKMPLQTPLLAHLRAAGKDNPDEKSLIPILREDVKDEMTYWFEHQKQCIDCMQNNQCMLCYRRPQVGFLYLPDVETHTTRHQGSAQKVDKTAGKGYCLRDCTMKEDNTLESQKPKMPKSIVDISWGATKDFTKSCTLFGTRWRNGSKETIGGFPKRTLHLCGTCAGPKTKPAFHVEGDRLVREEGYGKEILTNIMKSGHPIALHHIEYQFGGIPHNPRPIQSRAELAASPYISVFTLSTQANYVGWYNNVFFTLQGKPSNHHHLGYDFKGTGPKGKGYGKAHKKTRVANLKKGHFVVRCSCPELVQRDAAWGLFGEDEFDDDDRPPGTFDDDDRPPGTQSGVILVPSSPKDGHGALRFMIYHDKHSDRIQKMTMTVREQKGVNDGSIGFDLDSLWAFDSDEEWDEFMVTADDLFEKHSGRDSVDWTPLKSHLTAKEITPFITTTKLPLQAAKVPDAFLKNNAPSKRKSSQSSQKSVVALRLAHGAIYKGLQTYGERHDESVQLRDAILASLAVAKTAVKNGKTFGEDQIQFSTLDWDRKWNPGAGNCLYLALEFYIGGKLWETIKEEIMIQLARVNASKEAKSTEHTVNGHWLEDWCRTPALGPHGYPQQQLQNLTGKEYVEYQRQAGKWGGTIEIWTASEIYHRTIIVVSQPSPNYYETIFIAGARPKTKKDWEDCIVLLFDGGAHYEALVHKEHIFDKKPYAVERNDVVRMEE